jgi:hypothetical protein
MRVLFVTNPFKARLCTEMRGMPTPSDVVPALERLTADYRGVATLTR